MPDSAAIDHLIRQILDNLHLRTIPDFFEYRISRNDGRGFPNERSLNFHSMFLFFLSRFSNAYLYD